MDETDLAEDEMPDESSISKHEHLSKLADAELGVAEALGWAVAGFAGLAVHLAYGIWLMTIPVAIGSYILATHRYRKRAAKAEDEYFRSAGLGKYTSLPPNQHTVDPK